jgi:hypothetical protein
MTGATDKPTISEIVALLMELDELNPDNGLLAVKSALETAIEEAKLEKG